MMDYIPVIDFDKCSIAKAEEIICHEAYDEVGSRLYEAFSNIGFAYLKNTGVTKQSIDRLNEVTATFFKRSHSEKINYERNTTTNFGYVGLEQERVCSERPGDYKEAFDASGDAGFSEDANWPDALVPEFSQTIKEFMDSCKILALRILHALSFGMKLKVQTFQGKFIDAVPIDNTVVVNVGDMLQFMTCGELKSTVHRVLLPRNDREKRVRRSIAYFVHADRDEVVNQPLVYQDGVEKEISHKPNASPITAYEHVRRRWDDTY